MNKLTEWLRRRRSLRIDVSIFRKSVAGHTRIPLFSWFSIDKGNICCTRPAFGLLHVESDRQKQLKRPHFTLISIYFFHQFLNFFNIFNLWNRFYLFSIVKSFLKSKWMIFDHLLLNNFGNRKFSLFCLSLIDHFASFFHFLFAVFLRFASFFCQLFNC